MTTANDPLIEQAKDFASDLTELLQRSLPSAPGAIAEVLDKRVLVRPDSEVRLYIGGEHLASLQVRLHCQLDSEGTWLAIDSSTFGLVATVDKTPLIRFDYLRGANKCPGAHIQVHVHRGALSHLLSRAGHRKPHEMSALHIPVGGSRLRPCLEDVIQFLIVECLFDSEPEWKQAVEAGRTRWRRTQVGAITRAFQSEAAEALVELGWSVSPPALGVPETKPKSLHAW